MPTLFPYDRRHLERSIHDGATDAAPEPEPDVRPFSLFGGGPAVPTLRPRVGGPASGDVQSHHPQLINLTPLLFAVMPRSVAQTELRTVAVDGAPAAADVATISAALEQRAVVATRLEMTFERRPLTRPVVMLPRFCLLRTAGSFSVLMCRLWVPHDPGLALNLPGAPNVRGHSKRRR